MTKRELSRSSKFLLVSSNSQMVEFLRKSLIQKDRLIVVCRSGAEALVSMSEERFTLILMEVSLHDMNAHDVLSNVRLKNNHWNDAVILMSQSNIDEEEMHKGYQLGVIDYFVKPININLLLSKIRNYYRHTILPKDENAGHESNEEHSYRKSDIEKEKDGGKREFEKQILETAEPKNILKEMEARYKDIFENTIEGIFQTTPEGMYIRVNESLAKIYGYDSTEELVSTFNNIETQLYVLPQRRQEFISQLENQDRLINFQSQVYRKDKTMIWIKENARAVRDLSGNLLYYEGTVSDISEGKVAMQTLIETNESANRFVPHQLVSLLGKNHLTELNLDDHAEKKMSILFSDIRSFTKLSEQMKPIEIFNFLNSYLRTMGPIMRKNGGFIDKYIGDSIMALFESAQDAYQAAMEMREELKRYNIGRKKNGYQPIKIGIGINTGRVIVGTIGERHRIEGTVIGDAVNIAARIEQLTKRYHIPLLIAKNTFDLLDSEAQQTFQFIETTMLQGKSKKIAIYGKIEDHHVQQQDRENA